jgi:hypothetical protein
MSATKSGRLFYEAYSGKKTRTSILGKDGPTGEAFLGNVYAEQTTNFL